MTHAPDPFQNRERRFVAERGVSAQPRLARALARTVAALAEWRPDAPLRFAGHPARLIETDELTLAAYLREVEASRARGEPQVCVLSSSELDPDLSLFVDMEPRSSDARQRIWFSLPDAPDSSLSVDSLIGLAAGVCEGFGAWFGRLEDEFLLMYYRARTSTVRARSNLPPELRAHVPDLPADESGLLPELLLPSDFDDRKVPDAVWWLNYWDAVLVANIGAERLRQAGFDRLVELEGGGVTAVVTEQPLRPDDPVQLARVRSIIERLDLRRLQEEHRETGGRR